MTVAETLALARSYGVEVRLNAAGDGLDLEVEADPPSALVKVLRRAKWDILAALRQHDPLPDLLERHRPLLGAVEDARPPDATDPQWQTAMRGLRAFLAAGHGDQAEAAGWPHNELYRVPELWSQIHLCCAALLIGDCAVTEVTSTTIQIKTSSGATQSFYQRPKPDFGLDYAERVKLLRRDVGEAEARARALEHMVAAYDGARPSDGVAMSHSVSQTATGADIGRGRSAGFPGASGAGEANTRVAPTFYEFFAGGGMAREGLGPEWTCLFANDNAPKKVASYAKNWGRDELVVCGVANLTTVNLPGSVDLAWSSPPCVGASLAGKRGGLGPETWIFTNLLRGLRAESRAPKMVAIENVPDMLTSSGGRDFDRICDMFTDTGYRYGALTIDAALFVPQSRERVFVIAVDKTLDVPASIVADRPSMPFHTEAVVEALRRQKAAASTNAQPIWWRLPVPPRRNTIVADVLEGDDRPGVVWDGPRYTDAFIASMAPKHLDLVEEAKTRSASLGGRVVKCAARRTRKRGPTWEMRDDDIAGCLRTADGGSSIQRLVFVEGDTVRTRRPTPREYARLMGLPDTYKLPANTIEAYSLVGDGVVVPVVRFLAEHILEPILQASTRGGEPSHDHSLPCLQR
jgi:DNA (cytosine-5)-methyltransferase 1